MSSSNLKARSCRPQGETKQKFLISRGQSETLNGSGGLRKTAVKVATTPYSLRQASLALSATSLKKVAW